MITARLSRSKYGEAFSLCDCCKALQGHGFSCIFLRISPDYLATDYRGLASFVISLSLVILACRYAGLIY